MSIASALFSDSQVRIFRWLFGQPGRGFHLSELRRLTGLGSASLQRELNRLATAGLVRSERVGNLRRFQANDQSAVFGELAALVRKTLGVAPVLREALAPLAPRLDAAWIYGSIARQTETAASDVDVMLVGDDLPMADVLARLLPLEAQLGRKINPTSFTAAEFQHRQNDPDSFVSRVMAQPILPLIGEPLAPAGTR